MEKQPASAFPDFECAAYKKQAPLWRYLDHVYGGRDSWTTRNADGAIASNSLTENFLPRFLTRKNGQVVKEDTSTYDARLRFTPFQERYSTAIRDFCGLIFANGLNWQGVPDQILEFLGEGVENLLLNRAIQSMRRGHSLLLVDAPRNGGRSLLDARLNHPRWTPIDVRDVLNWRYMVVGNQKIITQATIRETQTVIDGVFGEKQEVCYLVLTPGRYDRFKIVEEQGKKRLVHLGDRSGPMGVWKRSGFVPLGFVPLVPLPGAQDEDEVNDPLVSTPPLKSLADLNVTHYQLYSDHLNKIRKVCRPVAVRVGTMGDEPELVLSSDTTVDTPPGGAFLFAEPKADSITQSRLEIQALETSMDLLAAGFLVKPSDRQAAMASLIQVAKVESGLTLFTRAFSEGVNLALKTIGVYLGIPPQRCGSLRLESEFFEQASIGDAQTVIGYSQLFDSLSRMPKENALALLRIIEDRGYLGKRFSAEQVANQLKQVEVTV